jgi:glycosyltransferase involved in cell wall biosynthesis
VDNAWGLIRRTVRILYISDNSSDHNLRFLTKFSAQGHDIFFFNLGHGSLRDPLPGRVFYVPQDPGIPNPPIAAEIETLLPQVKTAQRETRPDLVYAGPVQTAGYLAALSGFHPMIVMSWGSDLLLDRYRASEWKHATEAALRAADGFVCDCDAVRNAALGYVNFPGSRIAQLPWGVTPGEFSPSGATPSRTLLHFGPETIRFVCTRSWEPLYRIGLLLQAFLQAYKADNRLRLILIGGGTESQRIHEFVSDNSLEDVVLMPGKLPHPELPKWFRAATAYVSCAKCDGTSVSLLEAMSTGLPVVVSDIPSNREWVRQDENGWLASDADQFARRLLTVSQLTNDQHEAISRANRQLVHERADWDRNFASVAQLCERLVAFRRAVNQ